MTDQLNQAIQLIKSGQKEQARAILLRILEAEPHNENAWLWLTQCLPNDAQRIAALERCLKFNPHSERAQKGLAQLRQRTPAQPSQPPPAQFEWPARTPLTPPPAAYTPTATDTPIQASQNVPESPAPKLNPLQSRLARQGTAQSTPQPAEPFDPTFLGRPAAKAEKPAAMPAETPPAWMTELSTPATDKSQKAPSAKPAAKSKAKKQQTGPKAKRSGCRRWLKGLLIGLLVILILGAGGAAFAWYQFVFVPQQPLQTTITPTIAAQPTARPPTPLSLPTLPATYTPLPTDTPVPTHPPGATLTPIPSATSITDATEAVQALPAGPVVLYVSANSCVVKAVSVDGGESITLTRNPPSEDCWRPKFSPDGKKLAFILDDDNYDLYVMNLDGSELTMVAEATASFAWSPDSRQLAYHVRNPETLLGGLAIVNVDGSDAHTIAGYEEVSICTGCDGDIDISWSPDGEWIYAPADLNFPDPGPVTPNIFNVHGNEQRQLSNEEVPFAVAAAWSPDDRWLALPAVNAVEEGCGGLNIFDREGAQTTLDALEAHPYGDSTAVPSCFWENFQWSPDSAEILAYGHPRGDFDAGNVKYDRVLVVASGSEDVLLLAHWPGHPGASLWSPSGAQIIFVSSSSMDSFGSAGSLVIIENSPEVPEQSILEDAAKNSPGALFWLDSGEMLKPESAQPDTAGTSAMLP